MDRALCAWIVSCSLLDTDQGVCTVSTATSTETELSVLKDQLEQTKRRELEWQAKQAAVEQENTKLRAQLQSIQEELKVVSNRGACSSGSCLVM